MNTEERFGRGYFQNYGGRYDRAEMKLHFDRMADRLIQDFGPKSMLDAGCAYGLLVERLRDRALRPTWWTYLSGPSIR